MIGETILVIDSDSETTQEMVTALETEDFLVFTAPSGDVGITMAKKVNPSMIFVNPAMAGTSGLEVCKTIHSTDSLKNVPIVVLSAFDSGADPRYTTVYGIVGSLKKPFTSEELVAKTRETIATGFSAPQAAVEPDEFSFNQAGEEPAAVAEEFFAEEPHTPEPHEKGVHEPHEPVFSDKSLLHAEKEPEPYEMPAMEEAPVKAAKADDFPFADEEKPKAAVSKEPERTSYTMQRNIRRQDMGNKLLIPIIAIVAVVVLGGAGFFLYKKNMIPWIGKKAPVQVAAKPAQQEPPKTAPAADAQTVQPSSTVPAPVAPAAVETKPATPPAAPAAQTAKPTPPIPAPIPELKPPVAKTAPTPAPAPKPAPAPTPVPVKAVAKPDAKPSGKTIYSVQIGAFKSEANASALTKQYKDKGYDAFTQKAQKDKETIYRALVGRLDNAKEAAKLSETIRTKENIKGIIVKE